MSTIYIPHSVPSSKNSKVWTGNALVMSKSVTKWRRGTKKYWQQYREQFITATQGMSPIFLHIVFIRKTRHKFDYINPCQTILDEMVRQGWIEDDNADIIVPVFGKYIYAPDAPGVLLTVIPTLIYEKIFKHDTQS